MTERLVLSGEGYEVGEFSCPPASERWRELNWIGGRAHVVIPTTAVTITPDGAESTVATANELLVYGSDVTYRRGLISAEGDRCLFVALAEPLAAELGLARSHRLRQLPLAARHYAQHCLLRTQRWSPDRTDEWVLDLLAWVASSLQGPMRPLSAGQRQAVCELRALLASAQGRSLRLAEYAQCVHYSPFALARMFRAGTGYTIGAFRKHLRLRAALAGVLDHDDLATVAAEHGFSSHSHFTSEFRRAFGSTPSGLRSAQVLIT